MGDKTAIEWCDATYNPIVGCSRVSEGCRHCYAERTAGTRLKHTERYRGLTRLNGAGQPVWTGETRLILKELDQPIRWAKPRRIFVCNMGDLFHESVDMRDIANVFEVMASVTPGCGKRHQHDEECWTGEPHTFLVLTKRPERMRQVVDELPNWVGERWPGDSALCNADWPLPNVQLGVSVEDQQTADERIPILLQTPAAKRFVSAEPLLGPINFKRVHLRDNIYIDALRGYDYGGSPDPAVQVDGVIVGGESGPNARPMHPAWPRSIRDQCVATGTPYFFKQWGEWCPWAGSSVTDVLKADTGVVLPDGSITQEARRGNGGELMACLGKKKAGRHLDGSVWNQLA